MPSTAASSILLDAASSLFLASIVLGDVTNSTDGLNCTLTASGDYQDQLSSLVTGPPIKLIEMDIALDQHPPDFLNTKLKGVYKPYRWVRSVRREGQSLLMLEENYSLMSLSALSIGVVRMTFNISEHPRACLKHLSPGDVMLLIRNGFFTDFSPDPDSSKTSLGQDEDICNMRVVDDDGHATFRYQCCRKERVGTIVCRDMETKGWIEVLLFLIFMMKVVLVLYSPMFLPESFYRLKYVACQYIYHLPNEEELPLNIVVTEEPHMYGEEYQHKTIRLSQLANMEYFKTLVSSNCWQQDKVYEVKVKDVRMSVKARRLLQRCKVPVGICTMLYNNFFRCRIRKLEALKFCCESSILGRFSPTGVDTIKWRECMRFFSIFCQMVILASPWVIRLMVYGFYEYDMLQEREEAAQNVGLPMSYTGSLVMYLTPLHGVFIFIYVIIFFDSLIYRVISRTLKEKLNFVMRQCLRDMRERSRVAVCSWTVKITVIPFAFFGILGFILFPFYLVIVIFVVIPVVAFYVFPTVNLTVRLVIHLVVFVCPKSICSRLSRLSDHVAGIKKRLFIHEVTAKESFARRPVQKSTGGIILQLCSITMCLLTFWSVTLMMMEIASFVVEILCYTFMGVVVNAGITLQYCTVIGLLFWHGKNTFSRVNTVYQEYHQLIHDEILAMKKEEIDAVAKLSAHEQQHTAFRVLGDMTSLPPRLGKPVLRVKDNIPQWLTPGMLAFLDRHDTSYTPEKFFFNTINLDYFRCPGPVYANVLRALWDFAKIVLFLLFIFIIVLAFGDAYQISSTNQLLATVVGGVIPFFFRTCFQSSSDVTELNTTGVQFKFRTELHTAINGYEQAWPVFDIVPSSFQPADSSGGGGGGGNQSDYYNNFPSDPPFKRDYSHPVPMNSSPRYDDTRTDANQTFQEATGSSKLDNTIGDGTDTNINTMSSPNDAIFNGDRGDHYGTLLSTDKSTIRNESTIFTNTSHKLSYSEPLLSNTSLKCQEDMFGEDEDENIEINLIVDVSTSKTKRGNSVLKRKGAMESGSVSMLDFNKNRKNRTAMYTPNTRYQENLV